MTDLATLELAAFVPLVGETFRLNTDEGNIDLVLHEAQALGLSPRPGGAFSLVFRAPQDQPVAQQLHPIHHPALGSMHLFLLPIGSVGDDLAYEAILT
ncbi:DUF6916 family protein [Breoghania sp.]|uniref:DUF6916 family protein n=1 Tax=Breoghania sp. TaxID=2065378 RepID=UPI0029CA8AE2|nr:hypothetical protein [Breoghania sp.]